LAVRGGCSSRHRRRGAGRRTRWSRYAGHNAGTRCSRSRRGRHGTRSRSRHIAYAWRQGLSRTRKNLSRARSRRSRARGDHSGTARRAARCRWRRRSGNRRNAGCSGSHARPYHRRGGCLYSRKAGGSRRLMNRLLATRQRRPQRERGTRERSLPLTGFRRRLFCGFRGGGFARFRLGAWAQRFRGLDGLRGLARFPWRFRFDNGGMFFRGFSAFTGSDTLAELQRHVVFKRAGVRLLILDA
jgi:hypothetical protein